MKTVKHYEITQGNKTLTLELFQELQGVVQALQMQGVDCEAFTVYEDGTREPVYNLI